VVVRKVVEVPGFVLPDVEDITRREFLIGSAGLLLLPAGCGGGENGDEASGETRTVEHEFGTVELPVKPQRVVAIYAAETDLALVLDLPLAAAPGEQGFSNAPFLEYQREAYPERVEGIEKIAFNPEVNYEEVASIKPDCILVPDFIGEKMYEQLSRIAPTFVYEYHEKREGFEYGLANWRGSLRMVARAFGREDRAERFIADYEARAEDLRERLAERWSDATFAAVEPAPEHMFVFGRESSFTHRILFEDLGLTPASFLAPDIQRLSLEALPQVDADVLFVAVFAYSAEEASGTRREVLTPYLESPLWQKIPAVQKDQVYEFVGDLTHTSPLTANAFLDVVEESLLG
jgi:iron complex transport system substrate-binding protein